VPKTLSPADIEAFRNKLCDIAEELFAAHGPDGVTMRQLADVMGVSSMTPYRYFEDKDAILAAVRTAAFNRFAAAMEAALERSLEVARSAETAKAKVKPAKSAAGRDAAAADGAGNAYLDFALSNRAAYRMMFDVDQPTAEKYPDLVAAMDRARATMGAGLRLLAGQGQFKGDVEQAAHIYWSAMHGPVMLELAGLLQPPLDARAIATPMLKMLSEKMGVGGG
jgi:AcrR family transcriptional regulator